MEKPVRESWEQFMVHFIWNSLTIPSIIPWEKVETINGKIFEKIMEESGDIFARMIVGFFPRMWRNFLKLNWRNVWGTIWNRTVVYSRIFEEFIDKTRHETQCSGRTLAGIQGLSINYIKVYGSRGGMRFLMRHTNLF